MTFGQRIQQLRISAGLSQEELADKLGTTRQAVSKWELDSALPEIGKIVHMSKLFSVTTDSILVDGITTFDVHTERFVCGIYRSGNCEIAETEKFAYEISSSDGGKLLTAKLYTGLYDKKRLCAVCERDREKNITRYAYSSGEQTVGNDDSLVKLLGQKYDSSRKNAMKRTESFFVDHSNTGLPKVSEAGIKNCLTSWRMRTQYKVTHYELFFTLCTEKTEYVFHIQVPNTNIYCGASNNKVFEMGLMGGVQYFRIRNYKDNTEPFCGFYSDFSYRPKAQIESEFDTKGKSAQSYADDHTAWMVKRYDDDEIVLQGCGNDEYVYLRDNDNAVEIICKE